MSDQIRIVIVDRSNVQILERGGGWIWHRPQRSSVQYRRTLRFCLGLLASFSRHLQGTSISPIFLIRKQVTPKFNYTCIMFMSMLASIWFWFWFQDDGSPVSIFSLSGSNAQDGHLAAGRNGVKRLRTVSSDCIVLLRGFKFGMIF